MKPIASLAFFTAVRILKRRKRLLVSMIRSDLGHSNEVQMMMNPKRLCSLNSPKQEKRGNTITP